MIRCAEWPRTARRNTTGRRKDHVWTYERKYGNRTPEE